MVERVFRRDAKKLETDTGWIIIEKDGTTRKAKSEEVPKNIVDGEGVSPENGILCKPNLDGKVRKRAKRI